MLDVKNGNPAENKNLVTYQEYKERWDKRSSIENIQPYAEHIELFLSLIYPDYCKAAQESLANYLIKNEEPDTFYVTDKKFKFHWQVTDDLKDTIKGTVQDNIIGVKAFYGTPESSFPKLQNLNVKGSGIFTSINVIEGTKRLKENVVAIQAIWIEDDTIRNYPRSYNSTTDPLPLPPSFIVETSRGKYHYYWLTFSTDLKRWERIQKEVMTELYNSDPGANGLNRALRVPGFWHRKHGRPFPTRIVFILGQDNIPIQPFPSDEFKKLAEITKGVHPEFGYSLEAARLVKRYSWEEIEDTFGSKLASESIINNEYITSFSPNEAIERVLNTTDYHGSLHALCMHFANYQQDANYVTFLVEGLMCRVPESERDQRWTSRFNDIRRSAIAAVIKKSTELAQQTLLPKETLEDLKDGTDTISIHSVDWHMPFPEITNSCIPLKMLMNDFENSLIEPIKSFNFATIISFFAVALQNIPLMPTLNTRTANGCHLLLSPSASGKDLNISLPLKQLARQLLLGNYLPDNNIHVRQILTGIMSGGEITSLSAFHNWASQDHRKRGAIWINTECTSLLSKMSADNNNVANLTEVVINIQDGEPIIAVTKSKSKEEAVGKELTEAYSLLFASQPASIKRYMTPELLYKGLIGRFDYYISDKPVEDEQKPTLSRQSLKPYIFSKETLKFVAWMLVRCGERVEEFDRIDKRHVAVIYEDDEADPLLPESIISEIDGPRRSKHVEWERKCVKEYQMDDPQFNTFLSRVPMSTERWLTILSTIQHLWECYLADKIPFQEPIQITDALLEQVISLGEYQYKVRKNRIWALIGQVKGLDEKHMAVLEAIKQADKEPSKWLKYIPSHARNVANYMYENEKYIPISSVARFISYDVRMPTRDLTTICQVLQAMGYIDYIQAKQIDIRISDKPVKNIVRLTQQGRV